MSAVKASDRLIVALDFPEVAQARALVATLGDSVSFYKIGMELAYGGEGFALADELAAETGVVVISNLYDDSLGDPPVTSYDSLMRFDVTQIVNGLDGAH